MKEVPMPLVDQEAEIATAVYLFDKRIRQAIANKWGTVSVVVSVQGGRIASVKDGDESVWQLKRQKPPVV